MSVSNITVIDKYICTLIHNYAVTQHTHIIFSQKYVVHIKTCHMKQIQCHTHNVYIEI